MNQYIVNLNNKCDHLDWLCNHFSIPSSDVKSYLMSIDHNKFKCINFIKEFGVNLLTSSENVLLTFRHGTTSNDNLEGIQIHGIINLNRMLSENTVLRQFLDNRKIVVDVAKHEFLYWGRKYALFSRQTQCPKCIMEKPCQGMNDYFCKYRRAMTTLHHKLYEDQSEIEGYLYGTIEDIRSYSNIRSNPEILDTIESICLAINRKGIRVPLTQEWRKRKGNKFYILEFEISIALLDISFLDSHNDTGYYFAEEYLHYYHYSKHDYLSSKVPRVFFENIHVINNIVGLFVWGRAAFELGQILPFAIIPFSDIRIIHQEDVE